VEAQSCGGGECSSRLARHDLQSSQAPWLSRSGPLSGAARRGCPLGPERWRHRASEVRSAHLDWPGMTSKAPKLRGSFVPVLSRVLPDRATRQGCPLGPERWRHRAAEVGSAHLDWPGTPSKAPMLRGSFVPVLSRVLPDGAARSGLNDGGTELRSGGRSSRLARHDLPSKAPKLRGSFVPVLSRVPPGGAASWCCSAQAARITCRP
jgi:hypothetical protein